MLINQIIKRVAGVNKIVVNDTFNRSNSTTTLGIDETGKAWDVLQGTWGIDGNAAYTTSTTGFSRAVINSEVSNCKITCTLKTINPISAATRIIFRSQDINNEWYLTTTTGGYEVGKRIAGSAGVQSSWGGTSTNGDIFKIFLEGSSIKIYLNESLIFNLTDSYLQDKTRHGICTFNSTVPRFDDFKVEVI